MFASATVCASVLAASLQLAARQELPLPHSMGAYATNVEWESPQSLLVATDRGVFRFSPAKRSATLLLSTAALPDGLPDPVAISSDGETLVATSFLSYGGFALRLSDHHRVRAQRTMTMVAQDVAVHAGRACVLAFTMGDSSTDQGAAFCGASNGSWTTYKPLHQLAGEPARKIFVASAIGLAGSIAVGDDGSFSVVTAAEPGVYRYSADGKLLEVLGRSLDQFVIDAMPEAQARFPTDLDKRYRLVLNTQPIVDDLVVTSRGPALVVRVADKEKIRWELLWPQRNGGAAPPLRLGIDGIGAYGHVRCAASGMSLACVGSKPPRTQARGTTSQTWAYLWLFDLPNAEKRSAK